MSDPANEQASRRILVLGSAPHSRQVTAHTWEDLPRDLNVADYDVVIMNFMPFLLSPELAKRVDRDALPSTGQVGRLLFSSGSEVMALGHPESIVSHGPPAMSAMWWLPVYPAYGKETGDLVRNVVPHFAYYFEQVGKWFFYWTREVFSTATTDKSLFIRSLGAAASDLKLEMNPIAETRFHRPIAFEGFLVLLDSRGHQAGNSSGIIWLPPTTRISHYEAVDLMLRERYGLSAEQTAPEWVEVYPLPRQQPIEEEITQHEQEIERLQSELSAAQERLVEATRYRRLLYALVLADCSHTAQVCNKSLNIRFAFVCSLFSVRLAPV